LDIGKEFIVNYQQSVVWRYDGYQFPEKPNHIIEWRTESRALYLLGYLLDLETINEFWRKCRANILGCLLHVYILHYDLIFTDETIFGWLGQLLFMYKYFLDISYTCSGAFYSMLYY